MQERERGINRATPVSNAREELRKLGYSLRRVEGEWQVKPVGDKWDGPSTYYSSELEDVVGTARFEAFTQRREA